jgi:hypothetical protein
VLTSSEQAVRISSALSLATVMAPLIARSCILTIIAIISK